MDDKRVILFSTGCPKCKVLKQKLNAKNINYIENNDVDEMESLGISSVPVLIVNDMRFEFSDAIKWVNSI